MRLPPPESAPLHERVRWVLDDTDPERLGRGANAYETVAGLITTLLDSGTPVTPDELGGLWAGAFGDDAWLLQEPHRFVLNQLTRRLQHLQPPAGAEQTAGAVSQLDAASTGRWLVRSRSTVHVLDLDACTYERRPGPTSHAFAYDNQAVHLTRVQVWPKVGGRMLVWFDDPVHPELLEHFRLCSRIGSITAADAPDNQS